MSKRTEELKNDMEKVGEDVKEAGRNVWLAGLGAFSEVESQGKVVFDELVEKGRGVQARQKKAVEQTFGDTHRRVQKVADWVTGTAGLAVDRVSGLTTETLQRFGIPTYEDIRTLNERVAELNRKVENLGVN